jgi:hypothetical protein
LNIADKLDLDVGRHLYGIIGSYDSLRLFEKEINGISLSEKSKHIILSINDGIIDSFTNDEFRKIVEEEAKRPEPTKASISKQFESFMKNLIQKFDIIVLKDLELLFIYDIDFSLLRVLATDNKKIVLLLPGKRSLGQVIMYPGTNQEYRLPQNLIPENHLWEISN